MRADLPYIKFALLALVLSLVVQPSWSQGADAEKRIIPREVGTRAYLPIDTRIKVYEESIYDGPDRGRALEDDEQPWVTFESEEDTIEKSGVYTATRDPYPRENKRYFILAVTPDEQLYWSCDSNGKVPRFHTLDATKAFVDVIQVPEASFASIQRVFIPETASASVVSSPAPTEPDPQEPALQESAPQEPVMQEEGGSNLLLYLLISAIVVLLGGVGYLLHLNQQKSRRRSKSRSMAPSQYRPPSAEYQQTSSHNAQDMVARTQYDELKKRYGQLEEAYDLLSQRYQSLEDKYYELGFERDAVRGGPILKDLSLMPPEPIPPLPPVSAPVREAPRLPDPPPAPSLSPLDEAVRIYRDWCNRGGGHVNRLNRFEEQLRGISGAEVRVLYRERDALGLTFSNNARDPVEYWLVTIGKDHALFPRPLNPQRFKELEPVFEGHAVPEQLQEIRPALLHQEGDEYGLERKGSVR